MNTTRRQLMLATTAAATVGPHTHAHAWRTGTIKIVVPYVPGGTTDIAARLLADGLNKTGLSVVVENKAGANTRIGSDQVAKGPIDGTQLLLTAAPFSINPSLYPNMPYAPSDFAPISMIVRNSMVLVTHPSVQANTVKELLAEGKKNPKLLTFASAGNGTMSHMSCELLAAETGAEIVHVPYRGSGAALVDLVGGTVPLMFDNPSSVLQFIADKKLKAIAYTGSKRNKALPNVPTLIEQGFPTLETNNWFGLFAPAKTPGPLVQAIQEAVVKVLKTPAFKERFAKDGVDVTPTSAMELGAFVVADQAKWKRVIAARNIKPD